MLLDQSEIPAEAGTDLSDLVVDVDTTLMGLQRRR